jgi:hypothetical protein
MVEIGQELVSSELPLFKMEMDMQALNFIERGIVSKSAGQVVLKSSEKIILQTPGEVVVSFPQWVQDRIGRLRQEGQSEQLIIEVLESMTLKDVVNFATRMREKQEMLAMESPSQYAGLVDVWKEKEILLREALRIAEKNDAPDQTGRIR